jgi:hypothetical protein
VEVAEVEALRAALDGDLGAALADVLAADEVALTRWRADALLKSGRFPMPPSDRPAIPWPPF